MAKKGSITHWIEQLQTGQDGDAQQKVWNRYFDRLVKVARSRLCRDLCRVEDEEDVAITALQSFFERIKQGQFPELRDRTSLWPLLVTITTRKMKNIHRRHRAQKRDALRTVSAPKSDDDSNWLEQLADHEPTPEMAAETADEFQRLLLLLKKESLQRVARLKLEGYTNREIGERLDIMERSVERRLVLIRQIWTEHATAEDAGRPGQV